MLRIQPEAGFAWVSEVYLVISARWLEASGGHLVKRNHPSFAASSWIAFFVHIKEPKGSISGFGMSFSKFCSHWNARTTYSCARC